MKLNNSATEIFDSLTKTYRDATLSKTMVFKWYIAFKEGGENIENDPHSGRSTLPTNNENMEVM